MQQTSKYKLNLIQPEDVFSAEPLNANMEAVEAQLDAVRDEAKSDTAALGKRVTVLEKPRFACGTYTGGGGTTQTIALPFHPKVVVITGHGANGHILLAELSGDRYGNVVANGFEVYHKPGDANTTLLNYPNYQYRYAAFG